MLKKVIYFICLTLATAAIAETETGGKLGLSTAELAGTDSKISEEVFPDGIYTVSEDTAFLPRATKTNGKRSRNYGFLQIDAGDHFALKTVGNKMILTPMIDPEHKDLSPDSAEFKVGDLSTTRMTYVGPGDEVTLNEYFYEYSEVAGWCKRNTERHFGIHVPGGHAYNVTDASLAKVGFYPTSCSNAEMGVWRGGRGHMAWRTSSGGWSSGDFVGSPGGNYGTPECYSRSGGGWGGYASNSDNSGTRSSRRGQRYQQQNNGGFFNLFGTAPAAQKPSRRRSI